jgi:hypothetical protein
MYYKYIFRAVSNVFARMCIKRQGVSWEGKGAGRLFASTYPVVMLIISDSATVMSRSFTHMLSEESNVSPFM